MSYYGFVQQRPNHGHSCSIPGCVTKEKVSMYQFPCPKKHEVLRLQWFLACKLAIDDKRKKLWVCEKHFHQVDDYKPPPEFSTGLISKRFLKRSVIPHLNVPSEWPGELTHYSDYIYLDLMICINLRWHRHRQEKEFACVWLSLTLLIIRLHLFSISNILSRSKEVLLFHLCCVE